MCLNKNSFDLLLLSIVLYIPNYLEKRTENSRVLLNCHNQMQIINDKRKIINPEEETTLKAQLLSKNLSSFRKFLPSTNYCEYYHENFIKLISVFRKFKCKQISYLVLVSYRTC